MPITTTKPTSTKRPRPRFAIVLEAKPDASDTSGHRRLRRAVKALGRQFGLTCKSVLPEQAAPSATNQNTTPDTPTRPREFDSQAD